MQYVWHVTIPADTAKADAVEQSMHVTKGVVTRVQLVFPSGCWGLVHVRIFDGGHQAWPLNMDGDFAANGEVINFPESYDLKDVPSKFTFWAYNDDQTYSHVITARLTILPRWVAYPYIIMKAFTDLLRTVLGIPEE